MMSARDAIRFDIGRVRLALSVTSPTSAARFIGPFLAFSYRISPFTSSLLPLLRAGCTPFGNCGQES